MLLWLLLVPVALADVLTPSQYCVTAVYTAYNYLTFAGPGEGFYLSKCQNLLEVTSIYASSELYCRPDELASGFASLESLCQEWAHSSLIPREQVAANLTKDAVRHMREVELGEIPRTKLMEEPLLISPTYFDRTFRTIVALQEVTRSHRLYGYACYGYWAAVVCIGSLYRLFFIFWQNRRGVGPRLKFLNRITHAIQTHLVVAKPTQFLWLMLPSRLDAIVLGLFWILNTALCAISYPTFDGNIYWPTVHKQLLRYVADRTGIISFANLPLLWIFAGRNNIFLWSTGWSFATFNVFHRHVAIIAVVQAVVHTALYTVLFAEGGTFWKKINRPYLVWGTLAMVAMLLLLPMSLKWVRHRSYEFFLIFHIVSSAIGLVACFYHTIIFLDLEFWEWLWPAVAIWAFDRGLRAIRLLYCNLHVRVTPGPLLERTHSMIRYDEVSDIVWLQMMPGTSIKTGPGDYFYLYQPYRLMGWESHPFTVGALTYGKEPAAKLPSGDVAQVPLLSGQPPDADTPINSPENMVETSDVEQLTFWIRPYDGWTRSLREQCQRSPRISIKTTILLEGPYGHLFPVWNYESVLFVVGGTGIAAAVPYIQDHLRRSKAGTTRTLNMHLVWSSRQVSFLVDIAASFNLHSALAREDVRASFYSTGYDGHAGDEEILEDLNVEVSSGRPNLKSIVNDHAQQAQLSESSAAVLVCGPLGMAEETRTAVHGAMRQGFELKYVEESFTW